MLCSIQNKLSMQPRIMVSIPPRQKTYLSEKMINTLPQSLIESAKKILCEMATPNKEIKSDTFYHGTYSRHGGEGLDHASNIARHGISPRNELQHMSNEKEHNLTPVQGHTYTTKDLGYAQMYAIGGNIAGSDFSNSNWKPKHTHGYIFSFKGKKLNDIQPDEDSLGELYYKYHSKGDDKNGVKIPDFINSIAAKHATA